MRRPFLRGNWIILQSCFDIKYSLYITTTERFVIYMFVNEYMCEIFKYFQSCLAPAARQHHNMKSGDLVTPTTLTFYKVAISGIVANHHQLYWNTISLHHCILPRKRCWVADIEEKKNVWASWQSASSRVLRTPIAFTIVKKRQSHPHQPSQQQRLPQQIQVSDIVRVTWQVPTV